MNGCKPVDFSFTVGSYLSPSDCSLHSSDSSAYTTSDYLNLSSLNFNRFNETQTSGLSLVICKYDLNHNFVSSQRYFVTNLPLGENSVSLDSNSVYRFSYPRYYLNNFKGYQCNVGIGSMANELAFGKLTFLDDIGTIIPFVIPLIAFALGFLLLKKMIERGNQGHA